MNNPPIMNCAKGEECGYDRPWAGKCRQPPVKPGGRCKDHQEKCGVCGEPAVRGCAVSGSLTCGMPLCKDPCCEKKHMKTHYA